MHIWEHDTHTVLRYYTALFLILTKSAVYFFQRVSQENLQHRKTLSLLRCMKIKTLKCNLRLS